jgi:hypothetical protein
VIYQSLFVCMWVCVCVVTLQDMPKTVDRCAIKSIYVCMYTCMCVNEYILVCLRVPACVHVCLRVYMHALGVIRNQGCFERPGWLSCVLSSLVLCA